MLEITRSKRGFTIIEVMIVLAIRRPYPIDRFPSRSALQRLALT